MDESNMQEVLEDLALLLIYLTSWREKITDKVYVLRAWKGYDFHILDKLMEKGYINGSRRAKSVYLVQLWKVKLFARFHPTLLKVWGFARKSNRV